MIDFDNASNCNQCTNPCIAQFFDNADISILNQNKSEVLYAPGQIITKQGSFTSKIIFIAEGIVKISKEGKGGKNTMIRLMNDNNFLALPIHENQKKYPFTAIALTDVKICEINELIVHQAITSNQKLYDYLLDSYYDYLLYMINRLHLLNTRNNHGKLAASLLYLNSCNTEDISIFELVTRKDIAELSAISLESVNKILQELKNDRIIEINNKGIRIIKPDLIERLSMIG